VIFSSKSLESNIRSLAIAPDGKRWAAGCGDGRIFIGQSSVDPDPLIVKGHNGEVSALAFCPDGLVLVSGGEDRTVRQFDPFTAETLSIQSGHMSTITLVAFHPTRPVFLTADRQGAICFWNGQVPRSGMKLP
jgi:WD40 repeat protein